MFNNPQPILLKHNKCSTDQFGLGKTTPGPGAGSNLGMQCASPGAPDYFKSNSFARRPQPGHRPHPGERLTAGSLDQPRPKKVGSAKLLSFDAAPTLVAMSNDGPAWFRRTEEIKGATYGGRMGTNSITRSPNEGDLRPLKSPKSPLQVISKDAPAWMQDIDRKGPNTKPKQIGRQYEVNHSAAAAAAIGNVKSKKNGLSTDAPDFMRSTAAPATVQPSVEQAHRNELRAAEKEKLAGRKRPASLKNLLTYDSSPSLKTVSPTSPDWMSSPTRGREGLSEDLQNKSKAKMQRQLSLVKMQSNHERARSVSPSAPAWMGGSADDD